jgi:hypothetical protein
LLTRLGHLIEEHCITCLARTEGTDPHKVMVPLQAAAGTWRIAAGPRAGRKVLTLVGQGELRQAQRTHERCACGGKLKLIAVIDEAAVPSTSSGKESRRY